MKLVMTIVCGDEAAVVDAQIAFHLHAGVDLIVADLPSSTPVAGVLEAYAREGYVHLVRDPNHTAPLSQRVMRAARFAAAELDADWVLSSDEGEFWWPRGGTLKEVLAAIPQRYGVVRALPRSIVLRPDDGLFFAEQLTVRLSSQALVGARDGATRSLLRSVYRAEVNMNLDRDSALGESLLLPLRGWYPIEVFRLPTHGHEQAIVDDNSLARGLDDGSLVVDTRLRDVLRVLRLPESEPRADLGFARPAEGSALSFPRPSVVDDAAYAVEVAAFGEVDESAIRRRLDEAEQRIARLELTIWARAQRTLRRLVRGR